MEDKAAFVVTTVDSILRRKGENRDINLVDNLRDDLGLDSLDLAELAIHIEDRYLVDVFDGERFPQTVNDVIEAIEAIW